MSALLMSRSRAVQVACGTYKRNVPFQSYSKKVEEDRRTVLPTDKGVKPFSAIPGPPRMPFIGNLYRYVTGQSDLKKPYDMYSSYLKKYGPLVREYMYYGNTVVHVYDPKDIKEVYQAEAYKDPVRISHRALGKYRNSRKHLYAVPGLGVSNGKEWADYRQLFSTNLIRSTTRAAFEEVADDLIKYMKANLDHNGEILLLPTLYYYTLECTGALVLGTRFGCFDQNRREPVNRFIQAVHDTHYATHRTENMPSILVRKDIKILESSQDYMAHYIIQHMDYISNLIEVSEQMNPDGDNEAELFFIDGEFQNRPIRPSESLVYRFLKQGLSHPRLLPMAIDMFHGGIHSTAHTLTFALYHLAMNPDVQRNLHEELMKELPEKTSRVAQLKYLTNLGYCTDVIKETLRLNPSTIGTGRVLLQDLVLSGYLVPEGTRVILQQEVAAKEESNFPEPLKFVPGRSGMNSYANKPFAAARRMCLGSGIAMHELQIGLAKIMREFEVSYHHEKVGVKNCLVNEPDRPIKLRLKELPVSVREETTTKKGDSKDI